jgi:hemoglobin-like flavoprotein
MERSLQVVAETGVDIVPRFFARFHDALPGQRERFYNRGSAEGLMVNEIISMLLAQANGEAWLTTMLRASINTHHDHGGIELEHYRLTFDTLIAVLRETAGSGWRAEFQQAWKDQADQLYTMIERFY